jgi:diguanylate cyclase (GGDEF)-like protein
VHLAVAILSPWRLPPVSQIGADQLLAIVRATPAAVLGSLVNATIVAAALWGSVPSTPLLLWYFCCVALMTRAGLRWIKNRERRPRSLSRRVLVRAVVFAALFALPWAVLVTSYLGAVPHIEELVVIAVCAGMAASGSVALAPVYPAALAYMGILILPTAAKCFLLAASGYGLLGCLTLSYGAFLFAIIGIAARLSVDRTMANHQLAKKVADLDEANVRLAHIANHDLSTGLPNRILLSERIEQALERVGRGQLVAIHLLDLDRFKEVNDTLGHPAGDRLLQMAANRLQALAQDGDTIARMGGDEFAIVQVNLVDVCDAGAMAERALASISEPYVIDGQQVVIGVSIGVAIGCDEQMSADQLVRNADLALYSAKGQGRGMFRFFEAQMDAHAQERRGLERALRQALIAQQLELWYQPIVDVTTNRITAFEALLRWRDPERGLIPPQAFISLAEEVGLIGPIGEWVVQQACATATQWPSNVHVAVNLSPIQFRGPGLVRATTAALQSSGLDPSRLELEITEAALLDNSDVTLDVLHQLRELGINFAMDDFGTGYSSLTYLQSFPFDRIKIDRSFVSDITHSVVSRAIVRTVAALAKELGMAVTAEGVETAEQLAAIAAAGCTEMQGFLFNEPVPKEMTGPLLTAKSRSLRFRPSAA